MTCLVFGNNYLFHKVKKTVTKHMLMDPSPYIISTFLFLSIPNRAYYHLECKGLLFGIVSNREFSSKISIHITFKLQRVNTVREAGNREIISKSSSPR